MTVHLQKDNSGKMRQSIRIGANQIYADAPAAFGGEDSAPSPHDLFDAALAACKALTLMMYAQRKGIALDSVDVDIERDQSKEAQGEYGLGVKLKFNGAISAEDGAKLAEIAGRCPIHKLMAQSTITITTEVV